MPTSFTVKFAMIYSIIFFSRLKLILASFSRPQSKWPVLTILSWIIILVVGGCAGNSAKLPETEFNVAQAAIAGNLPNPNRPYRILPGDQLRIQSLRRAELNREVLVDPAGNINYPYVGDVQAEGLTAPGLAQLITDKIQPYYKRPELTVNVSTPKEQYVYVLGEVRRPGKIAVNGQTTLLAALGEAGGYTHDAELSNAFLIRGSVSPPVAAQFNLESFFDEGYTGPRVENFTMIPGDIILVPSSMIADVERFFKRMGNIIGPILDFERAVILVPELSRALNNTTNETTLTRNIIISLGGVGN